MLARLSLLFAFMMFLTSGVLRVAKPAPPASGLLVVANQKEHTLLLVDPDNRRELAKIVVGVNGHEVMASKDGRFAYVPIYGNSGVGRPGTDGSTIDVIDLQARKLAATIDLGKPLRPHRAEFGPDGLLYVTAELANVVDVIDPSTRTVLAEIASRGLCFGVHSRWPLAAGGQHDCEQTLRCRFAIAQGDTFVRCSGEILGNPGSSGRKHCLRQWYRRRKDRRARHSVLEIAAAD